MSLEGCLEVQGRPRGTQINFLGPLSDQRVVQCVPSSWMMKKLMPSFCLGGDPVEGLHEHCPQARRSSPTLVSDLALEDRFLYLFLCVSISVVQRREKNKTKIPI